MSVIRLRILTPLVGLLIVGLMGCASSNKVREEINFPDDVSQPFLTLQQIIDGETDSAFNLWHSIRNILAGPGSTYRLNKPTDMIVDDQNRLLIVDSEAGVIAAFIKEGNYWITSNQHRVSGIQHPMSIAAASDRLYISDLSSGVVHILDYDFKVVGEIEHVGMNQPSGLVFDVHGDRLLVVDSPSNRVFVFSRTGELINQIGDASANQSNLQRPISLTVDQEDGDIFVLDGIARKVKHYDSELNFVSSFGEYDQVPGSFAFPKGIALSSDKILFISDAAFGNIQLFDPSGALLYFFGETGTGQGEFLMPRNLFMDNNQYLYVADPYNNRVQVFKYYAQ